MSADTRGIRERLEGIKARAELIAHRYCEDEYNWASFYEDDVPYLLEQLEEALRKIERLEKSIEVRQ